MKYNANTKSTEKIEHIKNTSFATIETQILMFVNIFFLKPNDLLHSASIYILNPPEDGFIYFCYPVMIQKVLQIFRTF